MRIDELQQNWDACGRLDPLWAILSRPGKTNNRWDKDEFFTTGVGELGDVLTYLESIGVRPKRGRALEFGCGVGRITQALCEYFPHCTGIDIAPSMIELARRYNRFGDKCEYVVNHTDDLRIFPDDRFDFVYSRLVLQHMLPEYAKKYIAEFFRVLAPGGIAVFQLPAEMKAPEIAGDIIRGSLPPEAFKARIAPHPLPPHILASSWLEVRATVTNTSPIMWAAGDRTPDCPVRLGNHWLRADGTILLEDDARVNLEIDVGPMESVEMGLLVSTPAEPGDYILELDMVQERVAWFANEGSSPVRIHVHIEESTGNDAQPKTAPRIDMYGVPQDEVLQTIANAGGKVLAVCDDAGGGIEWASYMYVATPV